MSIWYEITIYERKVAQDTYLVDLNDTQEIYEYLEEEIGYLYNRGFKKPSITYKVIPAEKKK